MRRDPNTRVVHRPPGDDVVYKQRVNNMIMIIFV